MYYVRLATEKLVENRVKVGKKTIMSVLYIYHFYQLLIYLDIANDIHPFCLTLNEMNLQEVTIYFSNQSSAFSEPLILVLISNSGGIASIA
jgi:hypothetical protein